MLVSPDRNLFLMQQCRRCEEFLASNNKIYILLNNGIFMTRNVEICASGDIHSDGDLESKLGWYWAIQIDPKVHIPLAPIDNPYMNPDNIAKSIAFAHELKQYLPANYDEQCMHFGGCQGDPLEFSIPISDTTNPEEVEKIIKRHFPEYAKLRD